MEGTCWYWGLRIISFGTCWYWRLGIISFQQQNREQFSNHYKKNVNVHDVLWDPLRASSIKGWRIKWRFSLQCCECFAYLGELLWIELLGDHKGKKKWEIGSIRAYLWKWNELGGPLVGIGRADCSTVFPRGVPLQFLSL